jgi:hypothetical protein
MLNHRAPRECQKSTKMVLILYAQEAAFRLNIYQYSGELNDRAH